MRPQVHVLEDPAEEAARRLAGASGHVVLTGGSTPRRAYGRAAGLREDWSGVELWFSDERCVPPEHEHSNFGMVRETLLDRIPGAPPAVHRMEGELGPHGGADASERELEAAGRPRFGLVLLGLGPDAHVCSLFPGDAALAERRRAVVGVEAPGMAPLVPRITLTLPAVNAAAEVVFLIAGEDKAGAVARAFAGRPDPRAPGSLVRPESGSLTLLLDAAAASGLETRASSPEARG